jgi:hypothetical protein
MISSDPEGEDIVPISAADPEFGEVNRETVDFARCALGLVVSKGAER